MVAEGCLCGHGRTHTPSAAIHTPTHKHAKCTLNLVCSDWSLYAIGTFTDNLHLLIFTTSCDLAHVTLLMWPCSCDLAHVIFTSSCDLAHVAFTCLYVHAACCHVMCVGSTKMLLMYSLHTHTHTHRLQRESGEEPPITTSQLRRSPLHVGVQVREKQSVYN